MTHISQEHNTQSITIRLFILITSDYTSSATFHPNFTKCCVLFDKHTKPGKREMLDYFSYSPKGLIAEATIWENDQTKRSLYLRFLRDKGLIQNLSLNPKPPPRQDKEYLLKKHKQHQRNDVELIKKGYNTIINSIISSIIISSFISSIIISSIIPSIMENEKAHRNNNYRKKKKKQCLVHHYPICSFETSIVPPRDLFHIQSCRSNECIASTTRIIK